MTARVSRILLLLSIVAVAAIVFQPHPTVASGTVGEFHATLRDLGAPAALTPSRAEALLNAGMFVPATLLAMLAFDRLSWTAVVASAFLASLAIETIQGLLLDARTMQSIDVVTNTFGALLGALAGLAVRRLIRPR